MNTLVTKLRLYGPKRFVQFAISELRLILVNRLLLGSYSQIKEDLILDRLTGYKSDGFYVDVGSYDPVRFSNTMRFYRRGWHGINIEPDKDRWLRFQNKRKRDVNLNIGIAQTSGSLTYYRINLPTLSTFDKQQAEGYKKNGFSIVSRDRISVIPLRSVLTKYTQHTKIDFMSVDVEGMELGVLAGNDWNRFRPHVLCIESIEDRHGKISAYLSRVGYTLVYKNPLNSFYIDAI